MATWPPEGAEPVEVEYLYDVLAEAGLEYGPAFQGLTAAWREGEQVYAEVSLPEEVAHEAERFAIHPALLDAALHSIGLAKEGSSEIELPFSWGGVSLHAEGPRELRVSLTPEGERVALRIADGGGAPLAKVDSLALRPLDQSQLRTVESGADGLLDLEWAEAILAEEADGSPDVELWRYEPQGELPDAEAARSATLAALEAVQGRLSDEAAADSRLVLAPQGAVATTDVEIPYPAAAAIWGLIRSAQSQHPGRFALIDSDGSEASVEALPAALALGAEEPQLALREGVAFVPRLARFSASTAEEENAAVIDPERTVLITGATGGLGALTARHLAEHYGARHL